MAAPGISQLLTTATAHFDKGQLESQIEKSSVLWKTLNEKGNRKDFSGGPKIRENLEYQENGTVMDYSGAEILNIQPQEFITAADFDFKQKAVHIVITGKEQIENAGKSRIIELLGSKLRNATKSLANRLSDDVYSDGTTAKKIGGLQYLISDTNASGSVGGIDVSTWSFWRNYSQSYTMTTSNIKSAINLALLSTSVGSIRPDLGLADNNYYDLLWQSLEPQQRYTGDSSAKAGFMEIYVNGFRVACDGLINGSCPTNHLYLVNTDYLRIRPFTGRMDLSNFEEPKQSVNQDAIVQPLYWAGNMTVTNRQYQGVIYEA